jgi:hypothetical protein
MAKGGATVALHGRGVGGQHAEAQTVAEASADFPALELYRIFVYCGRYMAIYGKNRGIRVHMRYTVYSVWKSIS